MSLIEKTEASYNRLIITNLLVWFHNFIFTKKFVTIYNKDKSKDNSGTVGSKIRICLRIIY